MNALFKLSPHPGRFTSAASKIAALCRQLLQEGNWRTKTRRRKSYTMV